MKKPIVCLLGPTASGKTPLAIELAKQFPLAIVSVDSAMVYQGMNIGTAKPDAEILKEVPHRLIDIVDPSQPYSAGQFRVDALEAIREIYAENKIPLLVGGTMLYFRILKQGLAALPKADPVIREELQARAFKEGWQALHEQLKAIDPAAALKIHPNDSQRIQRALEVYLLTGQAMTFWQQHATSPLNDYACHEFALFPESREALHLRISARFHDMLRQGLLEEVRHLYARPDLSADLPAIRSVGYRQVWKYLSQEITYEEMCEQVQSATRQLAKRQMTWLRSWPELTVFNSEANDLLSQVSTYCHPALVAGSGV